MSSMTKIDGTPPAGGEAPAVVVDTTAPGTPAQPDEVTLLKSRTAGLDAKVTELQLKATVAEQAAAAAVAKLADYEAGKVQADEALRAQLALKDVAMAKVLRDAALLHVETKYPETFGVLGAVAATLTEDQLAASEARFAGVVESGAPTPLGSNPARTLAPAAKAIEDMSLAELRKHLGTFPTSVMTGQAD
jgi:hypothetical protein